MTPTAAELAEIRNTEYMPILMGNSGGPPAGVPWAVICAHEKQAQANHGQTLRGLANRGGLSWCEMLAVLEDRKWRKMDADHAQRAVLNHVSIFFRAALLSILDARKPALDINDPAVRVACDIEAEDMPEDWNWEGSAKTLAALVMRVLGRQYLPASEPANQEKA